MSAVQHVADIVSYNTKLTGFSQEDIDLIHQHRDVLLACAGEIVQTFYDRVFAVEETRVIFHDGERPDREKSLVDWLTKTLTEPIDDKYWQWQWYVGIIHIKRGVLNPMMLSMMAVVQNIILDAIIPALGPEEGRKLYQSLKRLTTIVTALIAEGYRIGSLEAVTQATGFSPELINTYITSVIDDEIERTRQEMNLDTDESA